MLETSVNTVLTEVRDECDRSLSLLMKMHAEMDGNRASYLSDVIDDLAKALDTIDVALPHLWND
jgi:hypothetical protein